MSCKIVGSFTKAECPMVGVQWRLEVVARGSVFRVDEFVVIVSDYLLTRFGGFDHTNSKRASMTLVETMRCGVVL